MKKNNDVPILFATRLSSFMRFRPGLRLWLALALVSLILVLALAMAVILDNIARREVVKVSSQNLENISRQMAREISSGMSRFAREVETVALLSALRNPDSSANQMRPLLDQFVAHHPEFSYVSVIDIASGVVLAANAGLFEGGSAVGRPVFDNGRKGLFLGDVHPAVRLAELLPKPPSGDALRFLDVALPIIDDNGVAIRVLATHISFEWTRALRAQILSPMKDLRGIEALLVDSAGKVVLAPSDRIKVGEPIASVLKGTASDVAQIQPWADGSAYLTVSSPVLPNGAFNGFGWRVVVRQSEDLALASAAAVRSSFFLGSAFLGCLAAGVAWLIANRITRPVLALAETARRIDGDTGETLVIPSGIGEIDSVQKTLAGLAKDKRRQSVELDERKRRFLAFADLMPHLVFETDASGRLEYANEQWVDLLGPYDGTSVKELSTHAPSVDQQGLSDAWERAQAEGSQLDALVRLTTKADSQLEWYRVQIRPIVSRGGTVERWVGTLTNVNQSILDKDNAEQALEREKASRAELERITLMKDDFLATLSHELRTPLNVVSGWAQLLETRANDPVYVTRGAGVIRRNIDVQTALISGLLDMSAIAAGKVSLSIQSVDVGQLLASDQDAFLKLAGDKGVVLRFELPKRPIIIQADARRVSQIISNILSNAIKFTEKSKSVWVRAWENNANVHIEIRDAGCGIDTKFLPHVFDRFRQQDSSMSREKGGVGLGLAIAKSLVELQNGKITAHSDGHGKGCTFTVTFPYAAAIVIASKPVLLEPAKLRIAKLGGARVLLVEDDADTREVTRDALRTLGASVECAEDATAALQWLRSAQFDLLVCDIGMAGMDGYELMERIRASDNPQIAKLRAIALTAFAMRHDLARAEEAGFNQHVSKPFSLAALSTAAEAVLV